MARRSRVAASLSEIARIATAAEGKKGVSVVDAKRIDLYAYGVKRWHWWLALAHPGLGYQRSLRGVEEAQRQYAGRNSSIAKIRLGYRRAVLKIIGILLGISVPPGVFGPGLTLPHYGSIVVNDGVRAGWFCRIHSSTNIGISRHGVPTLDHGVYVAPGAVLFGNIRVGRNAVVGANSVVNCDVKDGWTAVGVPAKPVQSKSEPPMPEHIVRALAAMSVL